MHRPLGRTAGFCVALIALAAAGRPARAQLLAYESFDYAAGSPLGTQSGGTGFASAWTAGGSNTVTSSSLSFTQGGQTLLTGGNAVAGLGDNSGNLRTLSSAVTTGTVYVSVLVNGAGTVANYSGVSLFNGGGSENLFVGKTYGASTYGLDQSTGSQNSGVTIDGTTRLLVVRIDLGANAGSGGFDRVRLYVDPTPGDPEPGTALLDVNTNRTTVFDTIRVQSGDQGAGSPGLAFDEIRIGTTFGSVAPVPEPAGLLALAATLGGAWRLRRRAATPSS